MNRRRAALAAALGVTGLIAVAILVFPERAREIAPDALVSAFVDQPQDAAPDRAAPVRLTEVRRGVAVERFETAASVRAEEMIALAAEGAGRVAVIAVQDGARVARGDVILRFDDGAQRARVEAASARLAEAAAELARAKTLQAREVVAETRVETARAAAETAQSELEAAQEALADRTVRAPFDGRVGFLHVDVGAWLGPGDVIAELAQVAAPRLRFALPLSVADAVAVGDPVSLPRRTGPCASAQVTTVSPINDAATRTRAVEARLEEGCQLAPGALATVAVETARRPGAVIAPGEALLREGFDTVVFRAVEDEGALVARRTLVEVGAFMPEGVEIRDGLQPGVRIVVSGLQRLRDGAAIRPVEDGARRAADAGGGAP